MVIVLMGVSGSGKTTVGVRLAAVIGCGFYDGDDYHPPANVEKMSGGTPLTEADREPWLRTLGRMIGEWAGAGEDAVLACSALSARSRALLGTGRPGVELVYLKGATELIAARLAARRGHYMPAGLLRSQFAALEEPAPGEAMVIDIAATPEDLAEEIRERLG